MGSAGLASDAVQKIGFQMLIAVRMMRLAVEFGVPKGGALMSRLIRHVYGAEIHWDATVCDGVGFVHGLGIVISHAAVVGPRCVLFQNVTLGESIDPLTRLVGAPSLEADVHVGAGAVLIGPITVGKGTKIMANAVLDRSVGPNSIVRSPVATIGSRTAHGSTMETPNGESPAALAGDAPTVGWAPLAGRSAGA